MAIFNKYNKAASINNLFIFLSVISLMIYSAPALSTAASQDSVQDLKKLHITADSMIANQNNQHVIFSGQVIALYDLTTIKSDKLQVFYNNQSDKEQVNEASVKKIIASGNVHIEFEGKTATCDQAVYNTSADSLILTGDETRLQSEKNYITGNKITIYQGTGQVIVNGDINKRVNAVFQPDKNSSISDIK